MTEQKKPEQGTQPEAGEQNAPPAEAPRASDLDVTAAAREALAPTTTPPALAAAQAPKANPVMRGKVPTVPANAPLYRVRKGAKPHFLNGRVVKPGEQVRYAGVPGRDLEPLDEAAKKAAEAAAKERAAKAAEAEKLRIDRNKLIKALKGL